MCNLGVSTMDAGHEGNEGSERRETVSPAATETPTEPSEQEEPATAPPAGADLPVPPSSSLSPSSDHGSSETEPSTAWAALYPPPLLPPPLPPLPGRRNRWPALLAVGALVVLIAAAVGYASTRHRSASSTSPVPTTSATASSTTSTLPADSTSRIVRLLDPAIVDINTINQTDTGYAIAAATGMIVSSNGFIVTNNHVVEEATSIKVAVEGHASQYSATFVGADPAADVAVIKLQRVTGLPIVHFGNSSSITIGDRVVAIGNAGGRGGTPAVTTGTISALGRAITASDQITLQPEYLTGMIETNASIEPGNSGGPLVDDHGLVIGMNTAADPGGYALPIDRVSSIATAIEHGRSGGGIVLGLRAFLGVVGERPAGSTPDGVHITRIVLGDPAAQAGIEPGDVIEDIDGKPTPTVFVLQRLVLAEPPGDVVSVTFSSPSGQTTASVRLVDGPAP
jgi:S1-C subfamily serine protease